MRSAGRLLLLAGVLALVAALWWGPSALARYAIGRGLASVGYRIVELGDVAVSLIRHRIDIGRIQLDQPGGGVAGLDLFDLQISPMALLSGRLDVPRARLSGLSIEIARASDGTFRIAGIPVPTGEPGADGPSPQVEISDFELAQSHIVLRGNGVRIDIAVRHLSVDGLRIGDPSSRVRFELAGTIDGRPVKIAGIAMPFATVPALAARLDVDGLALEPLARAFGQAVAGTLDAGIEIRIEGDKTADGAVTLRAGSVAGVEAGTLNWRGAVTLGAGGDIRGKGVLDATGLHYASGATKAALGQARYDGVFEFAGNGLPADIGGTLALKALDFSAEGLEALSLEALRLDLAKVVAGRSGDIGGRVTFEGTGVSAKSGAGLLRVTTLQGQGSVVAGANVQSFDGVIEIVAPGLERAGARYSADRIGIDSIRFSRADQAGTLNGAATVDGLKMHTADFDLAAAKARYEGSADLAGAKTTLSGRLTTETLRAELPAAPAIVAIGGAQYDGTLTITDGFASDGQLRTGSVRVSDPTARDLFAASRIDISGLTSGPTGLAASRVSIADPRLLRRETAIVGREAFPWRLEAPRAAIEDARLAPDGGIAVAKFKVEGPTVRITRTKDGLLSFERGAPPVAGMPAVVPAPSPGLSFGRFEIADGRALFEDRTPHDVVRVPMDRLSFAVTDLDDRRPERPSAVSMDARVGSFGEAKIRGTVYPFAPRLSFDIEFAARSIDLPPISAYADEFLGVDVRTGTATVEGRVAMREETLDGKTKWRISNIQLDERETGTVELAQHAGAPVATALSLLADDNNNIELEIPVAGELSNPTFDTGDAMRQAVGGALHGALSNTLTVLFPLGTFISAVIDSERRGSGLALPTVAFQTGSAALEGPMLDVVDGLAKLLAARPAARLEVCGFANPNDAAGPRRLPNAPVDEAALREIAAARGEAVKRRLVETAEVDPARVFECRPVVETTLTAKPRAELKF
ncbi:MAG: DUF748 domain-containing protein [Proteobacteria bacterium]|nr:DUF748 domain-containing protein [Pseudomonadota bacterium]